MSKDKLQYRVVPRWLKNTDASDSNRTELGYVMYELLNGDIKSATPLCYFDCSIMFGVISPATLVVANAAPVVDVLQLQLPAAVY